MADPTPQTVPPISIPGYPTPSAERLHFAERMLAEIEQFIAPNSAVLVSLLIRALLARSCTTAEAMWTVYQQIQAGRYSAYELQELPTRFTYIVGEGNEPAGLETAGGVLHIDGGAGDWGMWVVVFPPPSSDHGLRQAKGPPADVHLDQGTIVAGQGMLAHLDSLATSNTAMRQMVVDLGTRHAVGTVPGILSSGPVPAVVQAVATPASALGSSPSLALMRIFTNGVADDRIKQAARLLADDNLTANEKLTKIDALIPLPATASAEQLGGMLHVTKQAVLKTDWWIQNRKGEKDSEVGRRREGHRKRAKSYEAPSPDEDDE